MIKDMIAAKMNLISNVVKGEFKANKKIGEFVLNLSADIYYLDSGEVVEIRYPNKYGINKLIDGDYSEYEYEELYGVTKEGYPQYPKDGELRPYQPWNMITINFPVKVKGVGDSVNITYPNINSYLYL